MSKTATTRPKTSSRSASKAAGSAAGTEKKSAIRVKAFGRLPGAEERAERMVTLRDGAQVVTSNRLRAFAGGGGLDAFFWNAVRFRASPAFATDSDRYILGSVPLTAVVKAPSNRRSTQKAKQAKVTAHPALIGDVSLHIATFVRGFDAQEHSSWKAVTDEYPKARLYGIECSPTSVAIDKGGKFSTRARLVIHVPFVRSDGTESFGSRTVPAFVQGTLKDDGKIKISEFRLSVNHPG
jgi:hypothetical protein